MIHVFCFPEHPHRPVWAEGAALGWIFTDGLCAGPAHHDPVTAGKGAAPSWPLPQPTFLLLTCRRCIKTAASGRRYRALLFCPVSNGLISLVCHFQHRFFWMHYFSVILIFLFVVFYGMGPCEYISGCAGGKFSIVLVGNTTAEEEQPSALLKCSGN